MGFDVFEIIFFVFMAVGIARVILEIFTGDPDEVITFENKDSWGNGFFDDELMDPLYGPMNSIGYGGYAGLPGNAFTTLYEEEEQAP